jgi:predicted phosphoribosyltransferase
MQLNNEKIKLFNDTKEAGIKLAERLVKYASLENSMIITLPHGGVPVAYEIAKSLETPLDVFTEEAKTLDQSLKEDRL